MPEPIESTLSTPASSPAPTPDAIGLLLNGLVFDEQGSLLGDPTKAYLASLTSERSRQTARERLRAAARVIGLDPAEAEAFPWHRLRFQHIDFIRSRLGEKDPSTDKRRAPATINLTLAVLRGIARYARNMNLMSDEEYRRIGEVKPATGEHLPAGRAAASDTPPLLGGSAPFSMMRRKAEAYATRGFRAPQ